MSVPVFFNARAGALKLAHHIGERQLFRAAEDVGLDVEVIASHSEDETRTRIRDFVEQGVTNVVVAGGDGTVSLAVQELAHTPTALGIIPVGTANNFATALHLPRGLPAALRVVRDAHVVTVDLGRVGEHYFTESAGVGLLADALAFYGLKTNKNLVRGFYTFIRLLIAYHPNRLKLYADGQLHSERAVLCEVMNTARTARALPFAPDAKLTDGQLDVVVVGDVKLWELPRYYRAAQAQQHHRLPKVQTFQARELRVEADHALNVHLNDRTLLQSPVTVTLEPGALRVLVERL